MFILWILIVFISSCSFKEHSPVDRMENQDVVKIEETSHLLSLQIDSNDRGEMLLHEEIKDNETHFNGKYFSLPPDVPDELIFTLKNINRFSTTETNLKAFMEYRGSTAELTVGDYKRIGGIGKNNEPQIDLEIPIKGFKKIFPLTGTKQVEIKINISIGKMDPITSQVTESPLGIHFSLLTPPSLVEIRNKSPNEMAERIEEKIKINPRDLKPNTERMILYRVIEIRSHEEKPIEVTIQSRDVGMSVTQYRDHTYMDLGCDYVVTLNYRNVINKGPFELLLFNDTLLSQALDRIQLAPPLLKEIHFSLQPETSVFLGLYGRGTDSINFYEGGHPKSNFYPQNAATSCHEECAQVGITCPGPIPACRSYCAVKKTVRDYSNVTVGSEFKNVKFEIYEQSLNFKVQYSNSLFPHESDQREIPFQGSFDIEGLWNN